MPAVSPTRASAPPRQPKRRGSTEEGRQAQGQKEHGRPTKQERRGVNPREAAEVRGGVDSEGVPELGSAPPIERIGHQP